MQIITSRTEFTPISPTVHARIWEGNIWRRDFHKSYFGGYRDRYLPVNSARGREMLAEFNHSSASCTPEVADFIDPSGDLRRAGLLFVAG